MTGEIFILIGAILKYRKTTWCESCDEIDPCITSRCFFTYGKTETKLVNY